METGVSSSGGISTSSPSPTRRHKSKVGTGMASHGTGVEQVSLLYGLVKGQKLDCLVQTGCDDEVGKLEGKRALYVWKDMA